MSLKNALIRSRAYFAALFRRWNNVGFSVVYQDPFGAPKQAEGKEQADSGSLSGVSGGKRGEVRESGGPDRQALSRVRELERRRDRADERNRFVLHQLEEDIRENGEQDEDSTS